MVDREEKKSSRRGRGWGRDRRDEEGRSREGRKEKTEKQMHTLKNSLTLK